MEASLLGKNGNDPDEFPPETFSAGVLGPLEEEAFLEEEQTRIKTSTTKSNPPTFLFTGGLAIASAITISLASVDLDSMVNAQFALFGCLLLACVRFCFVLQDATTQTPPRYDWDGAPKALLGDRPLEAVGPILFNFAFVVTAPPLSCGAHGVQSAISALTTACVIMGFLYAILGWVGASAAALAKDAGEDTNLLSLILRGSPSALDHVSVMVFGISQLAAIPVYCELARETLEMHIVAPPVMVPGSSHRSLGTASWLQRKSFYLCHVAPWLVCALTYNSTLFESFVEWSSLLLLGFCNFSLPLLLDILMKQQHMPAASGANSITEAAAGVLPTAAFAKAGGMGTVLWVFSITTATITAVIVQRMTESLLLAEGAFMMTVLAVINHF